MSSTVHLYIEAILCYSSLWWQVYLKPILFILQLRQTLFKQPRRWENKWKSKQTGLLKALSQLIQNENGGNTQKTQGGLLSYLCTQLQVENKFKKQTMLR